MTLSLSALREANARRAIEWNPSGVSCGALFAAVELAGEVGELLNELKKRERHSRGLKGGKDDPQAIAMELADVVICVDLLARELGVDLSEAVVAKFNSTSEKHGFATRLSGDHGLALQIAELEAERDAEKRARVCYQTLAYDAMNSLDKLLCRSASKGEGTTADPNVFHHALISVEAMVFDQCRRIAALEADLAAANARIEELQLECESQRSSASMEAIAAMQWNQNATDLELELTSLRAHLAACKAELRRILTPRPVEEWDDYENRNVLWWHLPVAEPPWFGDIDDRDEDWHTHWTPLPNVGDEAFLKSLDATDAAGGVA